MKKDNLGDRMKSSYEDRTKQKLPRRTYTIIRLDGRAFHTLTKDMPKPFYNPFMEAMDRTAQALCEQIMGVRLAYIQSDEISLLLTDFENENSEAWFDGNIQKMCSVSASIATAEFNNYLDFSIDEDGEEHIFEWELATFDSRVFTIPDAVEVENYFIWRQQDMERNSIQMVAQSFYSQKELDGKKIPDLHEMLHAKGENWNNLSAYYKRGRCISKPLYSDCKWELDKEIPIFTKDRNYLRNLIPNFPKNIEKE